ncbi:MAG: glycosyltransferase [bacterium]|nr:glycosyltransferase [bacterium]
MHAITAYLPSTKNLTFNITLIALAAVICVLLVAVKSHAIDAFGATPLLVGYTIFVTTFELSRIVSAMFYKQSYASLLLGGRPDIRSRDAGLLANYAYEPQVTFVIPCKNEEGAIRKTISQCFLADYPAEKIEVIVINDGSTDRTGAILDELATEYQNLVVIHWKVNRGKRHGMAEGFKRARGEIIVQLDSDSYIVPDTFRQLIRPFENAKIGAVCAHADPENIDTNVLTKMQAAYYFMSFRILKAAESTYGAVFCCSGCSSAYRKDIVLPIMDEWLGETFLGLPVTWGDDRGLTNWVLKRGYRTVYTDEALARTIVPETLKQFLKQQVRWKKGWLVNSIFASKFILRKEPFVSVVYFFPLVLVTLLTPFMATRAIIVTPFMQGQAFYLVFYMLGVLLVAGLILLYYRHVARDNVYWPYLFLWAIINMLLLSFLLFYALATIQNRRWGTR